MFLLLIISKKVMQLDEAEQASPSKQTTQKSSFYTRKKHPPSKKKKVVCINTSRILGGFRLLNNIIINNKWNESYQTGDITWLGPSAKEQQLTIATETIVNRIPGMTRIGQKKTLGYILNKFREYWPDEFSFYPRTYLLPEEVDQFQKCKVKAKKSPKKREANDSSQEEESESEQQQQSQDEKGNDSGVYIAKPSVGGRGDGIILVTKATDIPQYTENWIVQTYIDRPLLLEGKKFDLRLYVLITSVEPYICYLCQQGLARFCVQEYEQPKTKNLKNPFIHLTNYSLNKNHPNFVVGETPFDHGSKRCLKVLWEQLQAKGMDVESIRESITQLCQKLLTGLYPFLKYEYKSFFPKKKGDCFHIIGVDILIDTDLKPWLLEINHFPSFNIEHQACPGLQIPKKLNLVDEYVKTIAVEDALFLVRRSKEKQKSMEVGEHYYSYQKILDLESQDIQEMNIIENMLRLFHSQCSIRSKGVLSASQFAKLAHFQGMTSDRFSKNDYHLLFIKVMRNKDTPNQMTFEDFIDAYEQIVKEVVGYEKDSKFDTVQAHLEGLIAQLPH